MMSSIQLDQLWTGLLISQGNPYIELGCINIGKIFLDLRKYICTGNEQKGLAHQNRTCSRLLQYVTVSLCISRITLIFELVDAQMFKIRKREHEKTFMYDLIVVCKFLKTKILPLCSSHTNPLTIPYLIYRQAK